MSSVGVWIWSTLSGTRRLSNSLSFYTTGCPPEFRLIRHLFIYDRPRLTSFWPDTSYIDCSSWIMIKSCYSLNSGAASWDPLGTSTSWRKFAESCASYTGLQAFLTMLERGGHRFKPKNHVLNTGLPLTKPRTLAKWNFTTEHCQKHLPAWIWFERRTWAGPTFLLD